MSPSFSLLLSTTTTHPTARSVCVSWLTCLNVAWPGPLYSKAQLNGNVGTSIELMSGYATGDWAHYSCRHNCHGRVIFKLPGMFHIVSTIKAIHCLKCSMFSDAKSIQLTKPRWLDWSISPRIDLADHSSPFITVADIRRSKHAVVSVYGWNGGRQRLTKLISDLRLNSHVCFAKRSVAQGGSQFSRPFLCIFTPTSVVYLLLSSISPTPPLCRETTTTNWIPGNELLFAGYKSMSPTDTELHHSASITSGLKNMLTNLWRQLCAVVVVDAAVRASCSATSRAERSRSRSTVCNHPAFWTLLHRPHATSCRCRASSSPTHNLHAYAPIDEVVVIRFLVSIGASLPYWSWSWNGLKLGLKIYV